MTDSPIGTQNLNVDIQALAAQMLGANDDSEIEYEEEDGSDDDFTGHPAWQEILSKVPAELHAQIIPTLQKWDTGVSRQFQKIHDTYAPLRQFEDADPNDIREALGVYEALNSNPEATWEAIGRVYGLSPQQVSQALSSDEEELDDLPAGIRDRLSRIDMHEQVLEAVTDEMLRRQVADTEAQEDEALEEYLAELQEQYGEFDEDYVVGLLAAGIDGDEAVEQYQEMVQSIAQQYGGKPQPQRTAPNVMSGSGGIPNIGQVDPYKLSNSQTQDLVSEILRMTNES
jgi:hypothetical protein